MAFALEGYQFQGRDIHLLQAASAAQARALLGLDAQQPVVAIVGRLGIEKDHRLFIDAAARLRRDQLGFVFQAFHVLPHLDVAQNVGLPLMLLQRPDNARVEAMLAAVGLQGLGQHRLMGCGVFVPHKSAAAVGD